MYLLPGFLQSTSCSFVLLIKSYFLSSLQRSKVTFRRLCAGKMKRKPTENELESRRIINHSNKSVWWHYISCRAVDINALITTRLMPIRRDNSPPSAFCPLCPSVGSSSDCKLSAVMDKHGNFERLV